MLIIFLNKITSMPYVRKYIIAIRPQKLSDLPPNVEEVIKKYNFKIIKPLVIALLHKKEDLNFEIIINTIKIAGNYIYRTSFLGPIPVKKLGDLYCKLSKQICDKAIEGTNNIPNKLIKLLKEENIRDVFDDNKFIEKLKSMGDVDSDKAKQSFIFLFNEQTDTQRHSLGSSSDLHIEHILPQTYPKKGWGKINEEEHRIYHQNIGNLMLLDENKNKKLQQKTFREKKKIYKDSDLSSINFLNGIQEWTIDAIKDRQNRIAKRLAEVWKINLH